MDGRPTWTDCDEAGDYVVPNVLSPWDIVFRPDNMDETVPHINALELRYLLHVRGISNLEIIGNASSETVTFHNSQKYDSGAFALS